MNKSVVARNNFLDKHYYGNSSYKTYKTILSSFNDRHYILEIITILIKCNS